VQALRDRGTTYPQSTHRDDLAIVQGGSRVASSPRAVLLFERLIGVIDQHEPEREAVYPALISDTTGRASNSDASFRSLVATTAIMLAGYLRGDDARAPRLVIAWAALAILDFGWAAVLITASFAGIITISPAPVMMGNPPLLIISLFALPLGIFISVHVIARMWRLVGATPLPLRAPTRE
jgi:hypothetical protein